MRMSNVQSHDQGAATGFHHQFLTEGIASYLDVVKALHLLQTEVAEVLIKTIDTSREQIAACMQLSQSLGAASRSVYPQFPMDTWDYDGCDIYASLWLGDPQDCSLHLGMGFQTTGDGMQACTLYCAVEVDQQYRRNDWLRMLQGHPDLLNEEWDGYAVGLRRPLKSPEQVEEESARLLEDFLECLRKSDSENS
jgi:hypothetical protein